MANEKDISKLTFEEAIKTLGDIVDSIEAGQTPLEGSIQQYEKGMELIMHCRGILQSAEKKIEKITGDKKT